MKNPIILPKKHLSWSQIELWLKSKSEYQKRYFEGKKGYTTKYMSYGSRLGELIAARDIFDFTEAETKVYSSLPKMDIYEYRIESEKDGFDFPVNVLAFVDAAKSDLSEIHEYKTSKNPWSQSKVDSHGQLDIYAWGVYEKTGKIPKVKLYWIETTEHENGKIEATGKVEEFERVVTIEQIGAIKELILKVAGEISEAYKKWQFSDEEKLNESDFELYIKLAYNLKDIQAQMDEVKVRIQKDLEKNNLIKYEHEGGTFSFRETKKYNYSDALLEQKAAYDNAKKEEEKNQEPEITKSLSFRGKY